MSTPQVLQFLKRVLAIADTGLLYAKDDYDLERYEELKSSSLELMQVLVGTSLEALKSFFIPAQNYPTPKVDIRALIINEEKEILLVQERADSRWALPGGWADIGYSPKEVIEKEVKEETGLEVSVEQLLAVYDKKCHPHPPQAEYVYKLVFWAKPQTSVINTGFDILNAGYFAIDQLPQLSENRILTSQINQLYTRVLQGVTDTYFD